MAMTKEETEKVRNILTALAEKYDSLREFSRVINQDSADVVRWRKGKNKVNIRCVVTLAQLYGIRPHQLRPDIFPEDCRLVFKK